jgi:hypothetical protein
MSGIGFGMKLKRRSICSLSENMIFDLIRTFLSNFIFSALINSVNVVSRDRTVRLIDRFFSVIPVIFFRLIDVD